MKKAMFWKLLERFGVQGIQFVLQIILARLLTPEHYGVLSIMLIFTSLANVFIQSGFNTALIQNKDVSEEDYSSVFWVTLGIAGILYGVMYFAAPLIAAFYDMPDIIAPFRVLLLMLFPGALNSIQLAKVSREMNFKIVFTSNVGGVLVSGIVGIVLAYKGAGIWALVFQTLLNIACACLVMLFTVKWKPCFVCNFARIKVLFAFGWKLLVSGLLDTLYQDLSSLVIGKKYSSDTLGFYNRGKQFPQFIISAVNGSVQSVLLPAMSERQEHKVQVKQMMRTAVMVSSYLVFPMMAGLAGVAKPLVKLLLTDKWLECVPYLRIFCFSFAFYPIHTSNLQAINAMGRSDIFLRLEVIKKVMALVVLSFGVFCFDSPVAIAMTGVVTGLISCFINASPNKKLIDYSYLEQIKDIAPSFVGALLMFVGVWAVELLQMGTIITLVVQVLMGVVLYIALSAIFKLKPFIMLLDMLKKKLMK